MICLRLESLSRVIQSQEALNALWSATYPGLELHGLVSDQWKEMGWQGRDPSTDFRFFIFIFSYALHLVVCYFIIDF